MLSSTSESLYSGAFPLTKRTSFSCTCSPAIVRLHRQLKRPCYHLRLESFRSYLEADTFLSSSKVVSSRPFKSTFLSFQDNHERTGVLSQRKDHLCHALPLPAVTTGNDSEGSASPSSTSEHEGKVWAKYPDVLMKFHRSFEMLNKVYQESKRSRWTVYGMNAWERMPPWIKLPTAIFLPWFLFVSAFYGPSVAMDLLPLWVIGPVMVGLLVKESMKMSAACRQWVADKKLKETALRVIEGARTGQWLEVAGTKLMEARLQTMEKKSKWVFFIRSGRFIVVLKQHMHRKLIQWWETWVDRYQDWRLVYLRWERTLKNIV